MSEPRGFRTSLKSVVVAAAILAELVPADATAQARFNGSCRFLGSASYDRPTGFVPKHVKWFVEGTGVCGGEAKTHAWPQ